VSLTVEENIRKNVKEIKNRLHNIQGRKYISLLPSHLVPESLSFYSVLEKSTADIVPRIVTEILYQNVRDI
jgi:hypothetical protein